MKKKLLSAMLAAAMAAYWLLGRLFGKGMEGFPGLKEYTAGWLDYVLILLYVPAGIILCIVYQTCDNIFAAAAGRIPVILREILGGLAIGAAAILLPMVLFSGEEEIAHLAESFGTYAPMFLIAIAFIKVLMTSLSIRFGLKGGHFFPLIFACVSMGFGLAMMFFDKDVGGHAAFAAGMVTAATLGAQMKKPLAVTMLLLIVFPVKMLLFIFVAAALSGRIITYIEKKIEFFPVS